MSIKEIKKDAIRKSRFSFQSKKAKMLGDSMMKNYLKLAKNIKPPN